jgi:hypothetical protein
LTPFIKSLNALFEAGPKNAGALTNVAAVEKAIEMVEKLRELATSATDKEALAGQLIELERRRNVLKQSGKTNVPTTGRNTPSGTPPPFSGQSST